MSRVVRVVPSVERSSPTWRGHPSFARPCFGTSAHPPPRAATHRRTGGTDRSVTQVVHVAGRWGGVVSGALQPLLPPPSLLRSTFTTHFRSTSAPRGSPSHWRNGSICDSGGSCRGSLGWCRQWSAP